MSAILGKSAVGIFKNAKCDSNTHRKKLLGRFYIRTRINDSVYDKKNDFWSPGPFSMAVTLI